MFFFHFFKVLIFWVHRGLEGQKTVQNDKKFCLSCSISQEPYIIWLSFMLEMCKLMISPGVFFFSMLKYWFSRLSRGWMGKKWPKMTKISGTICCMILIYGTHMYKRIISPGIFLFFLKILIFRIIIGKRAKSGWKWEKILSVSLCISGVVHHMIIIFATYV